MLAKQPEYDLIVIGSGPARQKAALAAAKQCYRVATIEQRQVIGGARLHAGTIPGKTLREAVPYSPGRRLHIVYEGATLCRVKPSISHIRSIISRFWMRRGI